MVVIQVHVGKQLMDDVLLEREFKVNIITKDLRKKLGLLVPKPTPYILKMAYQTLTKSIGLIKNLKIHIHGFAYIFTFIIMNNSVLDVSYSMLLGHPWFPNAKVNHDQITI
jgi:hypothetical protein